MKQKVVILTLIFISLTLTVGLLFYPRAKATEVLEKTVTTSPETIWVPDNYTKIQWAIGNASSGDTIRVRAGTYYEHPTINEDDLKLVGEDPKTTVINSTYEYTMYCHHVSNVEISGFTVEGSHDGIRIWNCSNMNISNNYISYCNSIGLFLRFSDNNTVSENTIVNNWIGIELSTTSGNILRNNNLTDNDYPLLVGDQSLSYYMQDVDASNIVNGKPIYYLVNQNKKTIPATAGYAVAVNCTEITVEALHLDTNVAVILAFTNKSIVRNLYGSNLQVKLECSSNNILSNNTIGSLLLEFSTNNTIFSNTIIGKAGRALLWVNYENYNNTFYHNTFIGITEWWQINSFRSLNTYEENYWSDYIGTDANQDGIGDTPYTIDENNTDNYPLMGMFHDFSISSLYGFGRVELGKTYHVTIISNSMISSFDIVPLVSLETGEWEGGIIFLNVTGSEGTDGFCRFAIPKDLLGCPEGLESWVVYLYDTDVTSQCNTWENSTHTFIYVPYNHSNQEIMVRGTWIVPEFPTALILPLLMIVTLIAVVLRKSEFLLKST